MIDTNRNGSPADVKMRFVDYLTRFENWSEPTSALDSLNRDPGKMGSRMNEIAPDSPFTGGTADFTSGGDAPYPF